MMISTLVDENVLIERIYGERVYVEFYFEKLLDHCMAQNLIREWRKMDADDKIIVDYVRYLMKDCLLYQPIYGKF